MELFNLFAKLTLDSTEYEKGLDESEKQASGFGKKIGTAFKVGAAAFAAVGAAAAGAGIYIYKQAGAVAEYGDNIDKMSQKMGLSAQAYQEWDAILQHSGTSIEAMRGGMKTLAMAVENGNTAFQELGFTQEELANMSQEELFGRTINALQNVEDETRRTYLASKLLGKGGTELGALLNTSAEETEAMRQRVHELGGVMSDEAVKAAAKYQDSLQDMTTAISSLKRNLVSNLLPGISSVMDGITEIFAGNSEEGSKILSQGIENIFQTIDKAIPQALEAGSAIFSAIGKAITDNFPQIMKKGTQLIISLAKGIVEGLPGIVEQLPAVVEAIAGALIEAAPELIKAGLQLMVVFGNAILDAIPKLVSAGGDLVDAIWDGIAAAFSPFMANMSAEWDKFVEEVKAVWENIKSSISKAWESIRSDADSKVEGIKKSVTDKWNQLKSGVVSKVDSLKTEISSRWNSIKNDVTTKVQGVYTTVTGKFDSIKTAITSRIEGARDAVKRAIDKIKSFFDFSWSLPKLKLPHPYISGSFSLNPPSVPHFGIDWYGKAMDTAFLLRGATVFGAMNGVALGGGERGNELVLGEQYFVDALGKALAAVGGLGDNIVINVYGQEGQDPRQVATEVQRVLTLWERQRQMAGV